MNAAVSSRPHTAHRRSRRSRRGRLVAVGALAATALLPSTVADAKSPQEVDPALMRADAESELRALELLGGRAAASPARAECRRRTRTSRLGLPVRRTGRLPLRPRGLEDDPLAHRRRAGHENRQSTRTSRPTLLPVLRRAMESASTISCYFNRHYVYAAARRPELADAHRGRGHLPSDGPEAVAPGYCRTRDG